MLRIGRLPQEERQQERSSASASNRFAVFSVSGAIAAWTLTLLSLCSVSAAAAGAATSAADAALPVSTPQLADSPMQLPPPDYSNSTDHELTRLGARWDRLSGPEREALLREVKLRMAQRKDADGVLMIRTQRRYGRVYSGNGRYLKIETKVIRVRPSSGGSAGSAGFGTGFEQRNAQPTPVEEGAKDEKAVPPLDAAMSPPVVRAGDPSS
jgi:hypothetical protein